jgi:hypothetical protein
MSNAKYSPFDFLNAINQTKEDLIVDDITEKQYSPYMVNRGLSYFPDTVLIANEININYHLDHKLQNSFYINMIRKRKRFSKWNKKHSEKDIEVVKEYYGYSDEKARSVLSLLSQEQIKTLKKVTSKNGTKRAY